MLNSIITDSKKVIYSSFDDYDLPNSKPESLQWRRPTKKELEDTSCFIGKKFRTSKNKEFVCNKISSTHIHFYNIEMEIRYCKFLLPTVESYSVDEKLELLKNKYNLQCVNITKGCQLHGDRDIELIFSNDINTVVVIPYNY